MQIKEKVNSIKGTKLLVSDKRVYGCYFVNTNKNYSALLEEIQVRLLAFDVCENEKQDLTVVFNTKYADDLMIELHNMSKVIRFNMVKL